MYLLNYIYFLIITLLGLKFLTMKRGVMVNPLNREQKMVMDGPEMFWVLTFSTDLLIEVARRNPSIPFRFAGAKREQSDMEIPGNVEFMGYLQQEELSDFICHSRFVVMPSRCYEGFPMAILEAACYGKPTIGPAHGGFTEIIGRGEQAIGDLFEPNNLDDLERKVVSLWNRPDEIARLGEKAFEKLKREYSSEVIYQKWDNLFQKLIKE